MRKEFKNIMFIVKDAEWNGLSKFVLSKMASAAGAPVPGDFFASATFAALKKLYGGVGVPGKLVVDDAGLKFDPHPIASIAIKNPYSITVPASDLKSARFTGQALVAMFSPRLPMAHIETSGGEVRVASQFQAKQISEAVKELVN